MLVGKDAILKDLAMTWPLVIPKNADTPSAPCLSIGLGGMHGVRSVGVLQTPSVSLFAPPAPR